MQNRGVDALHRSRVDRRRVAELVALAVAGAAFDAPARHPHREAIGVVVAAIACRVCRAPKLPAPDHQGFV